MNYELAKQLKEAGFPMPIDDCNFVRSSAEEGNDEIGIPTLEELIGACPKTLDKYDEAFDENEQVRLTLSFEEGEWLAGYYEFLAYEGDYFHEMGRGETPKEAVARLWLALNEENHEEETD